jgi:hypothetical protein
MELAMFLLGAFVTFLAALVGRAVLVLTTRRDDAERQLEASDPKIYCGVAVAVLSDDLTPADTGFPAYGVVTGVAATHVRVYSDDFSDQSLERLIPRNRVMPITQSLSRKESMEVRGRVVESMAISLTEIQAASARMTPWGGKYGVVARKFMEPGQAAVWVVQDQLLGVRGEAEDLGRAIDAFALDLFNVWSTANEQQCALSGASSTRARISSLFEVSYRAPAPSAPAVVVVQAV